MTTIPQDDPLAVSLIIAIREGDTRTLETLLTENSNLARCSIHDVENDAKRSVLHIATDWPGNFPHVVETIEILIEAGANVNAMMEGPNSETPLHWAASSNDVSAVETLVKHGADLNAQGAVIAGGDPLEDAIGFQNWDTAEKLVELGAETRLGDEAALGLIEKMQQRFDCDSPPPTESIVYSFWNACCAGQLDAAKFLLAKGGEINWVPHWCNDTPLDGAVNSENDALVAWLKENGARGSA